MTVVYIGGVKGVGKSTLLGKVLSRPFLTSLRYRRGKVAEVMFEILKMQGLLKKYDELEKVSIEVQKKVRLKSFQQILADRKGNLIFDGHYAISSVYDYSYGIPLEVVKKIDHFVLLHNNPKVVLKRRKKDVSKKRGLDLKKINLDLAIEEVFAKFYAQSTGKELKTIKTDNEAPVRLIEFLKEMSENG